MQSSFFEPKDLPRIEPPSPIDQILFVDPTLIMIASGFIGLLLCMALRSNGKNRAGWICIGLGVLGAAGAYSAGIAVTTQRELLVSQSERLVEAVAIGDQRAMLGILSAGVLLESRFASATNRDQVVRLATSRVPGLVDSYQIKEIQSDLPGPKVGRSMIKIRVKGPSAAPVSSWWMIHWVKDDKNADHWQASYVSPIWIQGVNNPGK